MTRIADGTRPGFASFKTEYAIGFHACTACKSETPEPPQSVLDELCRDDPSDRTTVWPHEHWEVPGWTNLQGYGWICDRCSRAVMKLLTARGSGEPGTTQDDLAALEENVRHAIDLASKGLLNDYPPPPKPCRNTSENYRFQHPTRPFVFYTLDDYQKYALRDRIREIKNVLLGRPIESED